jgi:uncharacterized cupredoxin-like copper-binding protein
MLARSVLSIAGIVALEAGLMSPAGFAATHSAALSVRAIVEARCQVAPVLSAAEIAASPSSDGKNPVSVNCSFPVPYQVIVHSDREALTQRGQSLPHVTASESGQLRPASLNLSAGFIEAANSSADANPGTVTVTIIY